MGNLNDKLIKEAYKGLIKTNDEAGITGTPKVLQDGEGNNLPVAVSSTSMVYSGTQDFSGATVVGISGGGGGTAGSSGTSGTSGVDGTSGSSGTSGGGGASAVNMFTSTFTPKQVGTIASYFKLNVPNFTFSGVSQAATRGSTRFHPVVALSPGQVINEIAVFVSTAVADSTIQLSLYSCSFGTSGEFYASTRVYDFGLVSSATTGRKVITGLNVTLPESANNYYYMAVSQIGGASDAALFGPTNSATFNLYASIDGTIQQRAIAFTGLTAAHPETITEAQWAALASTTATSFIGFKNNTPSA